ncbi:MAG TPA: LacI family DNA-binding transcriptional regulator [Acidimicrobiales bacterium]|nr:LacI family DNA-binding transcriptional regulator [Acidimicrobiales bacterium]
MTISDVAKAARVSPSTVSNLLNGRDGQMRARTRTRVLRAMEELGYQPSRVARQLRTGVSRVIGLVVPSVANPFWGSFARVLEAEALQYGYQMLLCNSERRPDRERSYVDELWADGVRTVVLGTSLPSLSHLVPAIERGLCLIALDREAQPDDPPLVSVSVDNRLGARLVTGHLVSLGHRRIGFVSGALATVSRRQRLAGYRDALAEAGLPLDDNLVWAGGGPDGYGDVEGAELGRKAMAEVLQLPEPPTGLVTINDMYAIGAIAAAQERGVAVPKDVSVVGFDDIVLAGLYNPPLTTVRQPLEEMARLVLGFVQRAYGASSETLSSSIVVGPQLVVRSSSGPPRSGGRQFNRSRGERPRDAIDRVARTMPVQRRRVSFEREDRR